MTALLALAVVVAVSRLPRRFSPLLAALPFFARAILEATERLGGRESLPFENDSLKHIALGLLLQIPFALFIFLLVRVAVVVVLRLVGSFVRPAPTRRETSGHSGARRGFVPKISIAARHRADRPSSSLSRSPQGRQAESVARDLKTRRDCMAVDSKRSRALLAALLLTSAALFAVETAIERSGHSEPASTGEAGHSESGEAGGEVGKEIQLKLTDFRAGLLGGDDF